MVQFQDPKKVQEAAVSEARKQLQSGVQPGVKTGDVMMACCWILNDIFNAAEEPLKSELLGLLKPLSKECLRFNDALHDVER